MASHRPSRLNLNSVGPQINAASLPRESLVSQSHSLSVFPARQDLSRKPRNTPPTTCSFSGVSNQGLPINLPLCCFSQTLRKWAAILHDPSYALAILSFRSCTCCYGEPPRARVIITRLIYIIKSFMLQFGAMRGGNHILMGGIFMNHNPRRAREAPF